MTELETKNWGIETENEIQKFSRLKGAGAYLTKTRRQLRNKKKINKACTNC